MRASESLALAYFVYLLVASWIKPLPAARRIQIRAGAIVMLGLVLVGARRAPATARDWAPALSILAAYYLSGRLFVQPSTRLETWLGAWDRRLLGDPTTRFAKWPRWLLAYLDILYMGCFLLVPAGFGVLAWTGHATLADRYWTTIAAAELGAFAPLAVFQTRPPWVLEPPPIVRDARVHRAASLFVRHGTIGANTFPSGHVAGSLAVAFALMGTLPVAGAVFLALSAAIAVACVVGRYHYVIDVVAGGVLAAVVWVVVAIAHI